MQYSIQRLSQCAEAERSAIASADRDVVIGNSSACDLRLHVSFGLPDDCVRIRIEDQLCVAENLTGDPGLVFVNGQGVFGVAQLDDGDALLVGSDQFAAIRVSETIPPPPPPSAEPSPVVAIATPTPPPQIRRLVETRVINSAVSRHHPCDRQWIESEVLEYLCDEYGAFLLANFRHAGLDLPAASVIGEDLYAGMPEEIRSIYSLHAVTTSDTQRKLKIYGDLKGHDAAIWCLPETDIETCLADAKLYLAWFARPSVLGMTLQESPKEFTEPLLKSFKLLFLNAEDVGDPWHIYAKPTTELQLSVDCRLTRSG